MSSPRKKKGGRVTPKGGPARPRVEQDEETGELFAGILRSVADELQSGMAGPTAHEIWTSQLWSIWRDTLSEADAVDLMAGGLIRYAAAQASPEALVLLRGLGAVAPPPHGGRAGREAERLAQSGVTEPEWSPYMGQSRPTEAWLITESVEDESASVIIGFDGPAGPECLSLVIDNTSGGRAKDAVGISRPVSDVIQEWKHAEGLAGCVFEELSPGVAAERWRRALRLTAAAEDAPVTPELKRLRALLAARAERRPGKVVH